MNQHENTPVLPGAEAKVIGEFPCTQTQLRFWVLDQLKPGNPALNVAVRWEIRGSFKASTIEAAFRKIIQRHEILRTRFVERRGSPYQQVLDAIDFKMSVIDLRNVPADQREQRILSIGEETASAPFDLARGGLFRVTLMMVENNRAFILITAHHTCFDGWSIRVLGRELGEIASALDAGRLPDLPDLPLQYGDFALWQQEYLASYGFETEKAFWKERLDGAPYFEVPTDHARSLTRSINSNIISVVKSLEFGERLEKAARDDRVSLYAHGVAVISTVLHRFTGATDILFDTQIAGREHSDLEPLIGVFINNLVMRIPVRSDCSFTEHIHNSSEVVLAAVNHQRMPFNKLVELVNPVRDPSRNPLIALNFNMSRAFLEDHKYGDFELISAPSQSPGAIYDISFSMVGRPSGWRMSIEYNTDLFDRNTIERMLELWHDTYDQALNNPVAPLVRDTSLAVVAGAAVDLGESGGSMSSSGEGKAANDAGTAPPTGLGQTEASPLLTAAEKMAKMGAIWADVLSVPQVRTKDNFFDLGGHSLAALRMISRVRDCFGIRPELAQLFQEPTLKGFSQLLFGPAEVETSMRAQDNPWKKSIYKAGSGFGAVYTLNHPFLYYRMAGVLDKRISVYNVNMFGATVEQTSSTPSFKEIAAETVKAMQVDPRDGPIALVGLCVNGVLAVEVTRQLREANVDVAVTAMIDSWAPGYSPPVSSLRRRLWKVERRRKRVSYFVRKLLIGQISPVMFLREFKATLWMMRKLGMSAARPTMDESANTRVVEFLGRAERDYRPEPTSNIMLFRSQATPRLAKELMFGWGQDAASIAPVTDLRGWHEDSLMVDGMRTLAASIEDRLLAERG